MAEPFHRNEEINLPIEKWQGINPKLRAGFTTRNGGYSNRPFDTLNLGLHVPDCYDNVLSNRQELATELAMPLEKWVSGEQIHRTNIHVVTKHDMGKGATSHQSSLKNVDGLITNEAGILCTAFFADCVPLYFFDPVTGYIGIAHAGWKGTVNHMGEKMVDALKAVGVNPEDLLVTIGPCISMNAYEVDENVVNHIDDKNVKNTVFPKENNRFLLDLKQLNVEILLQNGLIRHNIDVTTYCTFNDETLFFSHRRDKGESGRMLGYIGYKE